MVAGLDYKPHEGLSCFINVPVAQPSTGLDMSQRQPLCSPLSDLCYTAKLGNSVHGRMPAHLAMPCPQDSYFLAFLWIPRSTGMIYENFLRKERQVLDNYWDGTVVKIRAS